MRMSKMFNFQNSQEIDGFFFLHLLLLAIYFDQVMIHSECILNLCKF